MHVGVCSPSRLCRLLSLALVLAPGCTRHDANEGEDEGEVSEFEADFVEPPPPPMQLTASDGTGLRLVSLDVKGAVQAPLAFTELHMTFENPEDRILEGRFTIDLPPSSALSRFAMNVDGQWQEGEVVERQKARQTYERFLHNNVDPALLEKQAGNRFSARVFPIPARGRKELIISYSQALEVAEAPFRLPLAGLPQLDNFNAVFFVDEPEGSTTKARRRVVELHETDYAPTKDLAIETRAAPPSTGLRDGESVVARVQVGGETETAQLPGVTFAFDTSASRVMGFATKVRRFGGLVRAIADRDAQTQNQTQIRVLAYDQEVESIYEGPASEFRHSHLEALLARQALGASNLGLAFDTLARSAQLHERLVLVTDGINTAGAREVANLREGLTKLAQRGLKRLDAVVDTVAGDQDVLDALTNSVLPQGGTVSRASLSSRALVRRLGREVLPPLAVEVPGASYWWPKTAEGLQPGDTLLVYAEAPPSAALKVVLTGDASLTTDVPLMEIPGPLIDRALASARIDALTIEHSSLTDAEQRAELRDRVVDLSVQSRVISDFTAMLVLESGSQYSRFGIDRTAELDILTVGPEGVRLTPHARDLPPPPPPPSQKSGLAAMRGPADSDRHEGEEGRMGRADNSGVLGMMANESGHFLASPYGGAFAVGNDNEDVWGGLSGTEVGESFGVGGLGLVGTGRGGGGTGEGTIGLGNTGLIGRGGGGGTGSGFGGRGRLVPRVRQGKLEVQGPLDRDIVRRIVRAHLNEVRHCYNVGLQRDPELSGEVSVRFDITATGRVKAAESEAGGLSSQRVKTCVSKAVARWKFPKPRGGGNVEVVAPFQFDPLKRRRRSETVRPTSRPTLPPSQRRSGRRDAPVSTEPPLSLEKIDDQVNTAHVDEMAEVMSALDQGSFTTAHTVATQWRKRAPTNVLALVALGEVYEAQGQRRQAARVYGSLIDLSPSDAPMRRYAAARLQGLGAVGQSLALDSLRETVQLRPDHPSSHRGLAYALLSAERYEDAFTAIVAGLRTEYPMRYVGVREILEDDAALLAAAWLAAEPTKASTIREQVSDVGGWIADAPSTHFVLSWETDANDVDLHVHDGGGYHAWYRNRGMNSGGHLYADVTDGFGPESFTIQGQATAYPYRIDVHYFRRGPSGHGLGALQVVQHDGKGHVAVQTLPYELMNDGGRTRLLKLEGPLESNGS